MEVAALTVAEHPGEFDDSGLAGGQQFLAGEFRRGPEVPGQVLARGQRQPSRGRMQVGFIARRDLQNAGFHLKEAPGLEPGPQIPGYRRPGPQKRPAVGVARRGPPWRGQISRDHQRSTRISPKKLAFEAEISMLRPETASPAAGPPVPARLQPAMLGN